MPEPARTSQLETTLRVRESRSVTGSDHPTRRCDYNERRSVSIEAVANCDTEGRCRRLRESMWERSAHNVVRAISSTGRVPRAGTQVVESDQVDVAAFAVTGDAQ